MEEHDKLYDKHQYYYAAFWKAKMIETENKTVWTAPI